VVHVDEVEELLEVPVDGQQWQQEPRVDRLENVWLCQSVCVRENEKNCLKWQLMGSGGSRNHV